MIHSTLAELTRLQSHSGSFPSLVTRGDRTWSDHNGFTTAMVARILRNIPSNPVISHICSLALDYVQRCRSSRAGGAYGFWPEDDRPTWMPDIPADVDDTAIMTVELLRHCRITIADAQATVRDALLPHRISDAERSRRPPWVNSGAFLTWIHPSPRPNVVDCCVNANAVALLAMLDSKNCPGYEAGVNTILDGIAWAGGDPWKLRTLTPFYPTVHDLSDAMEHAVACGATCLRSALHKLREVIGARDDDDDSGCCCSAYGAVVWRCQALNVVRRLHQNIARAHRAMLPTSIVETGVSPVEMGRN